MVCYTVLTCRTCRKSHMKCTMKTSVQRKWLQEPLLAKSSKRLLVLFSVSVCLSLYLSVCLYVRLSVCRYTVVFIYYAFSLVSLLLCRPIISVQLTQDGGTKSIYAALYFLPILICVHAVLAGFICMYICYILLIIFT